MVGVSAFDCPVAHIFHRMGNRASLTMLTWAVGSVLPVGLGDFRGFRGRKRGKRMLPEAHEEVPKSQRLVGRRDRGPGRQKNYCGGIAVSGFGVYT